MTEVARRYGVTRQTVHRWLHRYAEERMVALREAHPGWGPRTIGHRLAREGTTPLPSRSSVYRCLVRHRLIEPQPRRRKRADYRRWERSRPMELWLMDVMGGVRLAGGGELKVMTGIDDHSRLCVCAHLTPRATARPVCEALLQAIARYGAPDELLSGERRSAGEAMIRRRHSPSRRPSAFETAGCALWRYEEGAAPAGAAPSSFPCHAAER